MDTLTRKLDKNAEKSRQLSLDQAINEPLEHWPCGTRAAPNALIRCALFRASRSGASDAREIHNGTTIAAMAGMHITYKGEGLDQRDLDAWLAVVQLYRQKRIIDTVTASSNQLLKLAGLSNSGTNHQALKERIKRLQFTQIAIEPKDPSTSKFAFYGSLIDSAVRDQSGSKWQLRLAPDVRGLFSAGYTWVDWQVRDRLKRSPLAQWCFSFYRSHSQPYSIKVVTIWNLCGSATQELRFFRNDLKRALTRVQEACERFDIGFHWEYTRQDDKIHVQWKHAEKLLE